MYTTALSLLSILSASTMAAAPIFPNTTSLSCPDYSLYSTQYHAPFSTGRFNLSSQRPDPICRTFNSSAVNSLISQYEGSVIADPDLYKLFENSFPSTLDTAVRYRGVAANNSEEELTFLITGDINAMWLRDSANQMQSYLPVLKNLSDVTNSSSNATTGSNNSTTQIPDTAPLSSLYRGVINLQTRFLLTNPFCNSFQPPAESQIPPSVNGAASDDVTTPPFDNTTVFECKYELDSLAAFLEISSDYFEATDDASFFSKFQWVPAVQAVLNVADRMMDVTTYYPQNGSVVPTELQPYTFERMTTSSEDTLDNSGVGNPTNSGTGLVRSAFRPSDDSCIYQLFIPANAMFSVNLGRAAHIMDTIPGDLAAELAKKMKDMSASIANAIEEHGVVSTKAFGEIYAFEVDGFLSSNLMDDANIPSLLSLPLLNYTSPNSSTPGGVHYASTRSMLLSTSNPYYSASPTISGIGGPHDGPGHTWPMSLIVQALTSDNATEIQGVLQMLVQSTDGLGLIHESVNGYNATDYTRPWFAWACGLFGQMVVDLEGRGLGGVLAMNYQ